MPSNERLGPEVAEVLRIGRKLTGKQPALKRERNLPGDARAMLTRPKAPHRPYEIRYARGQQRFLPHLIAHEVGHLVRLYQVEEEERLMPASTPETRRTAAEALAPGLVNLLTLGLPEEAIPQLFDMWLQGLGPQLANFPADLRIEAWIHEHFPGLRSIQERSLIAEVNRCAPLLQPEASRLTPAVIYFPTMAMNAAQAYHVAELYRRPELMVPFDQYGFGDKGRYLARLALDAQDLGHRSDMAATNAWAQDLGLTGWYEWLRYEGSR